MTTRSQNRIASFFFLLLLNALSVEAGEICLLPELATSGSVVRLGEIADLNALTAAERAPLVELALFPTPKPGLTRRVTSQEVRETLNLFGVSTASWQITGATRVTGIEKALSHEPGIVAPAAHIREQETEVVNYPTTSSKAFSEQPAAAETVSVMEEATALLRQYFKAKDRLQTTWNLAPQFTVEQAGLVAKMERPEITGGQAPYLGRQVFTVRDGAHPQQKAVFLKVDVSRNAQAVVARRRLDQGQIISSDDIQLQDVTAQMLPLQAVKTEEAAVGMEVTHVISEGQVLQNTMLRRRMLTRKGEIVTVFSVASGLQVKASARSLADAALGDVITLQALDSTKRYQARVTGPQECMVFVDAPKVVAIDRK